MAATDSSTTDLNNLSTNDFVSGGSGIAPVVNVQDVSVAENASIAASSLITSISNPSGDSITQYEFWDGGSGNGHFTLNGVTQADAQGIVVVANNLSSLQYVGGSSAGSETLYVWAYDATTGSWTAQSQLTASTVGPLGSTVNYTTFDGYQLSLNVMEGRNIAFLYPAASYPNSDAITAIVSALDKGYDAYLKFTGHAPTPYITYDGKLSIAVVPTSSIGAGAGYLGYTGIEFLQSIVMDAYYNDYTQSGTFDQAGFYELGRNFWFYGDQLAGLNAAATGFAIANRFASMNYEQIPGGPFGSMSWQQFAQTPIQLFDQYMQSSLTWSDILVSQDTMPGQFGGASDTAGSLFYLIYNAFGANVYSSFWQTLALYPKSLSATDAMNALVRSASTATGVDMSFLAKQGWNITTDTSATNNIGGLSKTFLDELIWSPRNLV